MILTEFIVSRFSTRLGYDCLPCSVILLQVIRVFARLCHAEYRIQVRYATVAFLELTANFDVNPHVQGLSRASQLICCAGSRYLCRVADG